ncbi:MAG: selenium metabolism-associated LysR family transcriptional regulator [Thermodesulfobacteriota bacterium]
MDLWQLHIFCKVIEFKSFSKAGKVVHLSQPTVSSHIKDLEDHFGCRLIDRLAREALPTKAGELLYGYARKLIALRDETEAALADFHGKIKGRLAVGGSTIPGGYILPRLVGDFIRTHPGVTLSLEIGDTEAIVSKLLGGTLELGIIGALSRDKHIHQEKWMTDELALIIPADHSWVRRKSVDIATLRAEPFISREPGSGTLASLESILSGVDTAVEDLRVVAEMGSTQAVIQGIKSGVGVSILSRMAVAEEIQSGILHALEIEGLDLRRRFYLAVHRHKSPSPLAEAFIRFLKKTPPAESADGDPFRDRPDPDR